MVRRLSQHDKSFEEAFAQLLSLERGTSTDVSDVVREIIVDVRKRGDGALHELNKRFDKVDTSVLGLAFTGDETEAAIAACSKEALDAIRFAADRIFAYHLRQIPEDEIYTDEKV